MGGILKKKIEKWLYDFEHSSLCWDADHVDYYYKQFRSTPKSQWIPLSYKVYDYILSIRDNCNYSFKVVLSFQLSYTRTHRPYPSVLKSSIMFRNNSTPPELYLYKSLFEYDSLIKEGIVLPDFKERTGKQVRLFEIDYSKEASFVTGEDNDYRFIRWIDIFE